MHIALVEDNVILSESIEKVLLHQGYTVTLFDNGRIARAWLGESTHAYDLIILDVILPEMSGFEIVHALRMGKCTKPILMLTSKDTVEDVLEGLDGGADDYLKKPFVFEELLARIRSLLRRQPELIDTEISITPDVMVYLASRMILRLGEEVHLTTKEFELLSYFIHNPRRILTQQELYDHVFDFAEVQMSNTIEVHVKNLRKKLRTKYEIPLVTIRNAGYRFDYGT